MRETVNKVVSGWVRMRVGVEIRLDLKDSEGFQVWEVLGCWWRGTACCTCSASLGLLLVCCNVIVEL